VLFMPGIVGRLFREFAVTIGAAVLVSGVVSLTLTPMLASRFLRSEHQTSHGHLYRLTERLYQYSADFYAWTLRFVLRHKLATILGSLIILFLTGYLFVVMPKGFIPSEDRSVIFCQTEAAEGISFNSMSLHQQALNRVVEKEDSVESFMSSAGGRGGFGATNTGFMFLRLKPREDRKHSADELITILRAKLAKVPGIRVFLQNPPPIQVGAQFAKGQYQVTLQSPNIDELYSSARQFEDEVRKLPGLVDVTSDLQLKNPQVNIEIHRDKASAFGVTAQQIEDALYSAYGSRQISTIYAPNNQYRVILELDPNYQLDPAALSLLYIRSSHGRLVPLNVVAELDIGAGPLSINHLGQLPAVTISFNLKEGQSLGPAVEAIQKLARYNLPASIGVSYPGTAQEFQKAMGGMVMLLIAAILVIYIVLGILYESFIHPITILTALPFAGFGALLTLMIFGVDLSIYAFVGIIMLVGLVKKNGIMMIDFAIAAQREENKSPDEAIYNACVVRFRPIMMTTMSALMAAIPLAVGIGAGAESRRPLGLAVVGGLIFSQSLTLYVTPVFYLYMEKLKNFLARRRQKNAGEVQQA